MWSSYRTGLKTPQATILVGTMLSFGVFNCLIYAVNFVAFRSENNSTNEVYARSQSVYCPGGNASQLRKGFADRSNDIGVEYSFGIVFKNLVY